MSELDALKNDGVLVMNKPETSEAEKTVIVLGVARGGTTMVASVLQALGVYMGDKLGPVLEDVALSQAVETHNKAQLSQIVAQRNELHAVWGWKRPSAVEHSDIWKNVFRNPYIVAVFRDPFAISNRNRISMLSDVFKDMEKSVQQLGTLGKFLGKQNCPILLCSYEKVLGSPEAFVRAVDEFLGLNAKENWPAAVEKIEPAPSAYLENSHINHASGHLDVVNDRFCSGWAFYPANPGKAAKVRIMINQQIIATVDANLMRIDVKEKGGHPTGLCGFRVEWTAGTVPHTGDLIEARVDDDVKPLRGSPRAIGK